MFKWQYKNIFSFYILDSAGNQIPVEGWKNYQTEYLSQISILTELADNGCAEYSNLSCSIEPTEILKLGEIDKQILDLPPAYPYEIYIQSDGQLNQNTFRFKYGFYDFTPNGNRFKVERNGAIISIEERTYLLSLNQYLICEALDEFNNLNERDRTFQNNLLRFAPIKALTKESASILDSYLQSQNVYHPDKIKIDLNFLNGILEIIPTLDIENSNGFVRVFDSYPTTKEVYSVPDRNGNTTRVVIDKNQIEQLQILKKHRKISDKEKVKEIAEHPENIFDDEKIDISVFYSERVKEIGVYKPRFYPFVCPYKSEWIPGIQVKDKVDGEKRIRFKTPIELAEFEKEKQIAERAGRAVVDWKGTEISIENANRFIYIAKKQFETPKEPITKNEPALQDEVLIIKENAELLEYVDARIQPEIIEHRLKLISNLNSTIQLKNHQREGIAWLQSLYRENLGGCLLADDMGLGKTLQLLYFIEWHSQNHNHDKPYLVVAPVSILEMWENEYQHFFKPQSLPLTTLYGNTGLDREFNHQTVEQLQRRHLILTNYETLRAFQFNLCAIDYAVVVLDEAQKIKTPGTLVTNVSKALKADFKIAMTGTPVENTLVDLWCIMDYAVPGLLGNAKDFAKEFQNPLNEESTDVIELGEKLRKKIGIFIKRRLKQDVAKDLPNKYESNNKEHEHKFLSYNLKRQMPPAQLERYKDEIEQAKNADLSGS